VQTYGISGAYFQYVPATPVVRDVDFVMVRGEVHGLVGENGAGKSTLIDLLTGSLTPQRGSLVMDGEPITFHSLRDAQDNGIAVVQQHYNVFPELSVVDNIMCLGRQVPRTSRLKQFDRAAARRDIGALLATLGIDIDPGVKVRTLGAAERKMVEVARVVRLSPAFLILDEPTAALEPTSSRVVLDLVRRLRARGIGVCFVSHRLDEVLSTSDRVTVLRNGERVACTQAKGLDVAALTELMVGEGTDISGTTSEKVPRPNAVDVPALRLRGVRVAPAASPVDIDVASGEILGLTGLIGSGASRLVRMVGGAEPLIGHASVNGSAVDVSTPRDAQRAGIGFIPENRKEEGSVPGLSVTNNMLLAQLSNARLFSRFNVKRATDVARSYARDLDVRVASLDMPASTLSGGNLQKVLIAKWLASGMRILAIDEPTHGVDVGGKARIHRILKEFARQGGAVVVSVSESHEAMHLCDRVAVMRHGEVVSVLGTDTLTRSEVTGLGADSSVATIEALSSGRPPDGDD
jgi:ABC-type sugar transport system ATPase subunit